MFECVRLATGQLSPGREIRDKVPGAGQCISQGLGDEEKLVD